MIQLTDNADIHLSSIVAENKVAGVKWRLELFDKADVINEINLQKTI